MNTHFTIRWFDPEHEWDRHVRFCSSTYPKGAQYILNRKDFFLWQFKNPFSLPPSSLLGIIAKKEIIGELGLIPVSVRMRGKVRSGAFLANLMVLPEYRGRGLGTLLFRTARLHSRILLNTGYTALVEPILRDQQWNMLGPFQRYIAILNPDAVKKLVGDALWKKFAQRAHRGAVPYLRKDTSAHRLVFRQLERVSDDVETLWNALADKYSLATHRGTFYLKWRYLDHPVHTYHLYGGYEEDVIKSVAVVRFDYASPYCIGRIVDFFSADDAEYPTFAHLVSVFSDAHADFIDFSFWGSYYRTALKRAGFFKAHKEPYSAIPFLFHPLVREQKIIRTALWVDSAQGQNIEDLKKSYFTCGDGDQDRPN